MEVDVDSGENKNPEDQRMVRAKKNKDTKIRQAIKKDLALAKVKVNEAGPEDFVPRPTPGVPG